MPFFQRLKEPFPEGDTFPKELAFNLGVGVFVTLFLYVIRPFGMDASVPGLWKICATFGLITFLVSALYSFLFRFVFKIKKDLPSWTLGKWILSVLGLILLIALSNFGYLAMRGWTESSLLSFGIMFLVTLGIGIFPTVFSGLMMQMNAIRSNAQRATDIRGRLSVKVDTSPLVTLPSQNKQEELTVALSKLCYLEAMQNYVAVIHLRDDKAVKTMLRTTLKSCEAILSDTSVIRCHRSFLVNTSLIEQVDGNAQGLRLNIKHLNEQTTVPVSRKYIQVLKNTLN